MLKLNQNTNYLEVIIRFETKFNNKVVKSISNAQLFGIPHNAKGDSILLPIFSSNNSTFIKYILTMLLFSFVPNYELISEEISSGNQFKNYNNNYNNNKNLTKAISFEEFSELLTFAKPDIFAIDYTDTSYNFNSDANINISDLVKYDLYIRFLLDKNLKEIYTDYINELNINTPLIIFADKTQFANEQNLNIIYSANKTANSQLNYRKYILENREILKDFLISENFSNYLTTITNNKSYLPKVSNILSFVSLSLFNPYIFMLMQSEFEIEIDKMLFDKDTLENPTYLFLQKSSRRQTYSTYPFSKKEKLGGYTIKESIDTTSEDLEFTSQELYSDVEMGESFNLELDDYLRHRKNIIQKQTYDSLLTTYDMKKALSGGDIGRMLADATGFSIPIPNNPLMGLFGKPEININVQGEANIRLGWRWDSQNLGTVSAFGQSQSTPIFNQDIRLNVSGGIGDKFRIGTDWNTRSQFDRQNRFKVGFDGYDDDIIKKVEFGNVTMPLTSTLIGGGQTLFGVRTDLQFGPLYLKTIFSQRRGERRFVDVRGGSNKQFYAIRAYDYAQNHFFLDNAYKPVYKEFFKFATPIIPVSALPLSVKEYEVWESTNELINTSVSNAVAHADLPPLPYNSKYNRSYLDAPITAGIVERGRFRRLDTNQFKIDRNLGQLSIFNLKRDRTYAVAYRTENTAIGETDDLYHGTFSNSVNLGDTLVLKLVYRPNLQPGFDTLWSRQMKNIYSLNSTNISLNETTIGLWYYRQSNDSTDILNGSADKLVTIFGVDRVNMSGAVPPDGIFDMRQPSYFFNAARGEITLPSVEPFREGLRDYFETKGTPELAELYVYNDVYDTTYDVAKRNTSRDRFVISGEFVGSGRSANNGRIALGVFNLSPGSVRVTLNGAQLKEATDYTVDYYTGTLQIRNERAMLPNANLRVEYEQQDIFQVSTKTLAGLRGDIKLFKGRSADIDFGFTLMHYDQAAVIDRVTIGQEPVSNTMFGFDTKLNWDTPWLTEVIDALPFFDTKAPSNINLGGEWAMMLPDPNKRKSTVVSDNGASVVYVDDFEGAQRYISLGMNPNQWTHSSQPVDEFLGMDDTTRAKYRAKMFWYKKFIPYIPITDPYPEQNNISGRNNIAPLEIVFRPKRRGIYNSNPEFIDESNPEFENISPKWIDNPDNRAKSWGGMQRLISSFNTNFDTENIEYIEIMMNVQAVPEAKMYLDLGQISEDLIPNQKLDTEDGITQASPIANSRIDEGEDLGIDGLSNEQEKATYPFPLNLEEDPAKDDYFFNFTKADEQRNEFDFDRYNNYESNSKFSESGQFPDTEILNTNNGQAISLDNSYFRYSINLNTDINNNPQIIGGNPDKGWYLYRIPIRNPAVKIGNPLFTNIQYARLVMMGGDAIIKVADWRLLGSQWLRVSNFQSNVPPEDSVMSIAFVSLFENSKNPDFYSMPPGVRAPRQLNNPDPRQDIKFDEKSLSVGVTNLRFGEERMAVRIFPRQDWYYYKKLKFFIHGDGTMPDNVIPGSVPKAYSYVRFGIDSSNYYEYRRPLVRGWQDIEIDLPTLTAIKQIRDTSKVFNAQDFPVPNDPFATFRIRGNPILTRIHFVGVGISNPAERFPSELTTRMWFNELRLIEPEDRSHWAGVGNLSVKLADLGNITASFNRSLPNFHKIEDRFGNRSLSSSFNINIQGNLEKFAPKSFSGMKLPITYTHAEFLEDPDFVANSDVNLKTAAAAARSNAQSAGANDDEAQKEYDKVIAKTQILKVQDSWALTGVKLGIPKTFFLIDETINKVTFGYSYAQEFERSQLYNEKFNWSWNAKADYANNIPEYLAFEPLKWLAGVPVVGVYDKLKLNLLPSNINTSLSFNRRRNTEQSRFLDFPSPVIRDFTSSQSLSFSWKLAQGGFINPVIDYTVNTTSNLVRYELDEFGKQRSGNLVAQQIFNQDGKLLDFGDATIHTQNVTINIKPKIPNIFGISKFIDLNGTFATDYNWNSPLEPDPERANIVKAAGFSNRIRFNMPLGLMALGESWFGKSPKPSPMSAPRDSASFFESLGHAIRFIFFDFNKVDLTFTQTNTANSPGIYGGTGMTNFWSRGFTGRDSREIWGPSFAYQMGLTSHPHGSVNVNPSSAFPFVSFSTNPGIRAANAVLQENYTQKSNFTINTSRPLWEGARLDLEWKSDVTFNRNQTVRTDADGTPVFTNVIAMESLQRSYLTFPSIFGANLFNNTIANVTNIFNQRRVGIEATEPNEAARNEKLQTALASSFYEGLEAFSITGGGAGRFLPSPNWGIRWEGLEKLELWAKYVDKIQFEHNYKSTYDEAVMITDKGRVIQNQQVNFGFQPLIGFTINFNEKAIDGKASANMKWNSTRGFNLNSAAKSTVSEQSTEEISIQANYTMNGFKFALLGIDMQNDLDYSFFFSWKNTARAAFNLLDQNSLEGNQGTPVQGNTVITLEPRARYSMSNRVTASLFFRYEATLTEGAAQPGFSTSQFGLDIRLSLSGGR